MADPLPVHNLRILIVDDEQPARERLRELLQDSHDELATQVVGEAGNGPQALMLFPECDAEVALVDIHMPVMSGIELARHLQALERPPAVVFITAHDQYAVQAFEVNAFDYLLKPVRRTRLVAALQKAAARATVGAADARERLVRADRRARRYLSAAERGKVTLIPLEDVVYLKADQKYVTVRTRDREFLIEETLAQLEEEFGELLLRVHRSCLVARRSVRGVTQAQPDTGVDGGEPGWSVVLEGLDEPIPISRRQWASVKALVKG